MTWSNGWWKRAPTVIDFGRASVAMLIARATGARALRPEPGHAAEVETALRTLLADTFGVKRERIDLHSSLVHDLGIDALDVIDVVTRIEATYGISFPEGELDALRTFEDFVLVTRALLAVREATEHLAAPPVQARWQVDGPGRVALRRATPLTPYDGEIFAADVARSKHVDAREISVPSSASSEALGLVDDALLASRLMGRRTRVKRVGGRPTVVTPEAHPNPRTPATNAAALRIARHAVDLLEGLSDERGVTVLHLASGGSHYEPEIHAARAQTNRRIAAFRTVVRSYARMLNLPLRVRLDAALDRVGDLGAIRAVADEFATTDGEILDAYHDVGRALTRYVWTLELGLPDPALVPQQMCLSALVAATEAGGTERAVIGCALARDMLSPADRADVAALIAEQRTQLELAMTNAPDDIASLLGRYAGDPLFASVADYESHLLGVRPDGSPGIDPAAWFAAMTAKLDRLHDVEVRQLERLMRDNSAPRQRLGAGVA
jgi:acyl carrier protein